MTHNPLRAIALAVSLALIPITATAASMGKLRVFSGQGEPLSAEIELTNVGKDELSSITANIASDEIYMLQGITRSALHKDIRTNVGRKADGTIIIRLTSTVPVRSNSFDMLIVMNSAAGPVLNEYTVNTPAPLRPIAAPPVIAAAPQPPIPAAKPLPAPTPVPQPAPAHAPMPEVLPPVAIVAPQSTRPTVSPKPAATERQVIAQPAASAGIDSYLIKPGDSLRSIANRLPSEDYTASQLVVGLYESNQHAFDGQNMNRLKAGKLLAKPVAKDIQSVPTALADRIIAEHARAYDAWRDGAANSTPKAPDAARTASGTITKPAQLQISAGIKPQPGSTLPSEDAEKAATKAPASIAGLMADQKTSVESKAQPDLADRTAPSDDILNEELTVKHKELAYANERIAMLEKQIADMQQLISMKNNFAPSESSGFDPESIMSKAKASGALPIAMILALIAVVCGGVYRRLKRKKQMSTESMAEGSVDAEIMAQMDDAHTDSGSAPENLGQPGEDELR